MGPWHYQHFLWFLAVSKLFLSNSPQFCLLSSGGFGNNNCGHSEDAGVKCSGPDLSTRCVADCGDGFYEDKNTCKRCHDTCKTCFGKPDRCASCNPPYFLEFASCVQECPLGKFGNTNNRKCELCNSQCQTCFNGEKNNLCKSCREGLFLSKYKQACMFYNWAYVLLA